MTPARGDVLWLDFDPRSGSEQAGKRPAVVLSPERYNAGTGLAVVCPMTRRVKGYPFEVPTASGRVPEETLAQVSSRLGALIGL